MRLPADVVRAKKDDSLKANTSGNVIESDILTVTRSQSPFFNMTIGVFIPRATAIDLFNPEPGTAANSGGPTALVDSTGRRAVGSRLTSAAFDRNQTDLPLRGA